MFQQLIDALFDYHPRLTVVEDQRGSQLLSMMSLTAVGLLILVLAVVELTIGIASQTNLILGLVVVVVVGGIYGANRFWGVYRASTVAFVATFLVGTLIIPFAPKARHEFLVLAFVPTLLTAVFFRLRAVVLVGVIVTGAIIGQILLYDGDTVVFSNLLLANIFLNVLMAVYVLHRDAIERLRHAEFDAINQELRASGALLQERVEERTHDLQVASQVAQQIAAIRDIDVLLPRVVNLTKESFNLYHAHIYLYDTDRQYLVLSEGAGEAGRIMKARGHRIPVDTRSLVTQAARENRPVIVDDVKEDPNFLANPLLPDTRSEAALPLAISGRVIGVLDVQSETAARFDSDLISVLNTFAGQLAISLESARLFSEMERTSRHEHVVGEITQAIQRATNIDEVLQVAARELGRTLRVSETIIELGMPQAESTSDDSASVPAVSE